MRIRDVRIFVLAAAIVGGLLNAAPASALSLVHEFASTTWGYTYAAPATKSASVRTFAGAHLDAKSSFVVTYNGFPSWAKADIQAALDTWAATFESKIPITVDATWGRSATYGVLGSAQPGNYFTNIPNAPDSTLYYPSALANAIAGLDLDKRNPEIIIRVNSEANWDQRNDGMPTKAEYDLESVFIHELGHGLGFLSTDSYDTFFKYGSIDKPTPFDAYAQTQDGRRLSDLASPSLELGTALTSPLVWSGPLAIAANAGVKPVLYTPAVYEDGSSVSHLDEKTYSSSSLDSVMTPNLEAGEVFQGPGPLLIAMMQDIRNKPPVGLAAAIPNVPRNVIALVGDKSTVISFDPPANMRASQVSAYTIKNNRSGKEITVTSSPVTISSLTNGTTMTFSVAAKNSLGSSDWVITNPVTPQAGWTPTVLDPLADAKFVSVTSFRNQPAVVYSDSKTGDLKVALWNGKLWRKVTIDGRGGADGRTSHNVAGPVSVCISGSSTKQLMHIFYTDMVDKDLRYALYDSVNFTYDIVDGNGPIVQPYDQRDRFRTSSDVSVTNACAVTAAGVQVFYRDEDQGVLLGAVKLGTGVWAYELVDGDRKTDGRSTGDVAFHMRAVSVGNKVSLLYDSVTGMNQSKQLTSGEIRLATRSTASAADWTYQNLDVSTADTAVVGFDVSLDKTADGIIAGWLTSTTLMTQKPNQIRWVNLTTPTVINSVGTQNYGAPSAPLIVENKTLLFGCESRLCSLELNSPASKPTIKLVTGTRNATQVQSAWIVLNKIRYALTSIDGKLTLLKP